MYLIRLAFAAAATAAELKQGQGWEARGSQGGSAFIRGERTSVSAGNEAFAGPAPATYSPRQPFLLSTLRRPHPIAACRRQG